METFKLIVDLIGKIIWPVVTLAIVLIFRNQIKDKFKALSEYSHPTLGTLKLKAEMEEIAEGKAKEKIEESKLKSFSILEEKIEPENLVMDSSNNEIADTTLLAFACGQSLSSNLEYNIYFDPATRRHNTKFKYIGLYHNMEIVAVGQLKKVAFCDYIDGELIATHGDDLSKLTNEEKDRIKGIINSLPDWELYVGLKFYLVDKFYKTKFERESSSPLRAKKYIWLDIIDGFKKGMSAKELAQFLNNKSW